MSGPRDVLPLEVRPGAEGAAEVLRLLPAALDGSGPALALAPAADDDAAQAARAAVGGDAPPPVDPDIAVVLATSGSTGAPRGVLLPGAALRASAEAALHRVGGPGAWTLALPATSAGGLQVLARCLLADVEPEVLASVGGASSFSPAEFAAATWRLDPGLPAYTSLVPAQAARLLDDEEGLAALRAYEAVLVGGARTSGALLGRLREAQVAVVTTYGMTETCGGVVYDGVPLDGVTVRIVDADTTGVGRIELCGAPVARGYLGDPDATAAAFPDGCHRAPDVGRVEAGRLEVVGRVDDVVQVGGVNVATSAVADALAALAHDVCVLAEPDDDWGARLTAYVVGEAPTDELAAAVERRLGRAAVPRTWVRIASIPLLANGKPDRDALRRLG